MASPSKSVSGLIGAFNSDDYYSFVVTGTQAVNLDLSVAFGAAMLDLYNSAGSLISDGVSAPATTNGDSWARGMLSPGTYYVEVSVEEEETQETAYTLSASIGVPPVGTSTSNAAERH